MLLIPHISIPQALHEPAVEAGITLLNEVGVDPGIDHMLAAQCFDEVKSKGGKVSLSDVYVVVLPINFCTGCCSSPACVHDIGCF